MNRAHIARWCAESNRPMNLVKDRQFEYLMKAGRPGASIPSPMTVSRDIHASFKKCRDRIDTILKTHQGKMHIATDAWPSPNHRAFVAWTAHLHHEGHILAFVLDVVEVPEVSHWSYYTVLRTDGLQSHNGKTLARAFHAMLIEHGLENKVRLFCILPFTFKNILV